MDHKTVEDLKGLAGIAFVGLCLFSFFWGLSLVNWEGSGDYRGGYSSEGPLE